MPKPKNSGNLRCPFCGGTNIRKWVAEWEAISHHDTFTQDEIDEHQCMDCDGQSFWT